MKPEFKMIYLTILISAVLQTVMSGNFFIKSQLNKPTVKVQQGRMQGIRIKNVDGSSYYYAFRGIPYAKPPVGKLRFKDPEPVEAWSGVKDAKKLGNVCAQKNFFTQEVIGNDDCLYLNVFTTDLNLNDPKSVMVWIHGGAFAYGSGNDDRFGADYIVQKNIVLVTINYRLGIFGFLNMDSEESPGNQGLKDQVMALKWVQQNIAKFGGNPKNVTIFGESAGSSSVHYLTLSPLAQGLFQRVILQNGVATNPWARTSGSMKEEAEKVADELGNNITDSKDLIEYLQNVDAQRLINAVQSLVNQKNKYFSENRFLPSVDSKSKNPFLNVSILEAVKSGIKVPHIIGYNSEPAITLLADLKDDDILEIEADEERLLQSNSKQFLQERNVSASDVKRFFMGDKEIERDNIKQFIDLVSADRFIINIHDTLKMQSSTADIPTYLYKFDHYSKETSIVQKLLDIDLEGTALLEDTFYLFNAKILEKKGIAKPASYPTEQIIHQRFIELWTNFAKTGNPNAETSELISVEWKPVDNSSDYNCLKISEDLSTIRVSDILHQLEEFAQKKN